MSMGRLVAQDLGRGEKMDERYFLRSRWLALPKRRSKARHDSAGRDARILVQAHAEDSVHQIAHRPITSFSVPKLTQTSSAISTLLHQHELAQDYSSRVKNLL